MIMYNDVITYNEIHQGTKNQMAGAYSKNGPSKTSQETARLETYVN